VCVCVCVCLFVYVYVSVGVGVVVLFLCVYVPSSSPSLSLFVHGCVLLRVSLYAMRMGMANPFFFPPGRVYHCAAPRLALASAEGMSRSGSDTQSSQTQHRSVRGWYSRAASREVLAGG
jgi:hypothetical protein